MKGRRNRSANRGSTIDANSKVAGKTAQNWSNNGFTFYQNQNSIPQRVTTYGTNSFGVINMEAVKRAAS